jgi:hypothetical protein
MGRAADWSTVQQRWEAGDDGRAIARDCRRPLRDIEDMAARERWNKSKRPSPQAQAGETKRKQTRNAVAEAVLVPVTRLEIDPSEELDAAAAAAQHLADFQAVRSVAMQYLAKIDSFADQVIPRMITSIAGAIKTVQDGQRKSLQMDAKQTDDVGTLEEAMGVIDGRAHQSINAIMTTDGQNAVTAARNSDDD